MTPDARGGVPPSAVLEAFGAAGTPTTLSGGQRMTWRVGEVVLKQLDTAPAVIAWQEEVLLALDERDDFRVAPPLRSRAGALVVEGWTAWRFEPGEHLAGRCPDILAVSGDFRAALRGLPRPGFLTGRRDRWAVADRVAWGELDASECVDVEDLHRLLAALEPVDAPSS